jgi:hypothetical protein
MFVYFVCCLLSRQGLCDELIASLEESYRERARPCVCRCVCDLEASPMTRPRPELDCCATEKKIDRLQIYVNTDSISFCVTTGNHKERALPLMTRA